MIDEHVLQEKNAIRRACIALRKAIPDSERADLDQGIAKQLERVLELRRVDAIAGYVSDGTEPNISDFLARQLACGKKIAFPRSEGSLPDVCYSMHWVNSLSEGWDTGAFNLREPRMGTLPMSEAEQTCHPGLLWLIPGVAFSPDGQRLGRGKSIYDRLLARTQGLKVGVFYDCQAVESLPTEPHDQPLDVIVTPTQILQISTQKI